jgi:hypothetical protein
METVFLVSGFQALVQKKSNLKIASYFLKHF